MGGAVSQSSGVKISSRLLQQTQEQMSCYKVLGHGKGAWRSVQWTKEERQAAEHFQDTSSNEKDGGYVVRLPRKQSPGKIGKSRFVAFKHYFQNETSLKRKGRFTEFEEAVQENGQLGHAGLIPSNSTVRTLMPCLLAYAWCV